MSGNQETTIGASIGIVMNSDMTFCAGDMLKLADEAMYRVKNGGKNSYIFFEEG